MCGGNWLGVAPEYSRTRPPAAARTPGTVCLPQRRCVCVCATEALCVCTTEKITFLDEIFANMSKNYMRLELVALSFPQTPQLCPKTPQICPKSTCSLTLHPFLTHNPKSAPESMNMGFEGTKMHRISQGIQCNTSRTPNTKKQKSALQGGPLP